MPTLDETPQATGAGRRWGEPIAEAPNLSGERQSPQGLLMARHKGTILLNNIHSLPSSDYRINFPYRLPGIPGC